ncbi:pentatricopeptide repeat-containing protein At5g16860 [Sesamum indicum]|uniref:Pentatricopeptide repeat-containing protein At5g16860 n=1 Tax=Sesamum indicum TaxID=4182 RepID=A0A6I9TKX5_SESIN|nr:pentatricopeptide repeat-containing protein At5g16860 [Sesamum indicum]XP_011083807.1 pentatricopeptide repeat-containing protein At5g16860 [Sesamum indicum]XP_011083808.1 pentatricopeptide repeat-containing protein At5g16860 [Sesamum indicum]
MLLPTTFPPKYRHCCTTLRPLLLKLYFSSSAAQQCLSLAEPELIHQEHVIPGVTFPSDPETTAQVLSNYLSSGRHSDTLSLLRRIPPSRSNVFYWNSLIKRSVSLQDQRRALQLFDEMRRLEWIPDGYTYPYVFKACGDLSWLVIGASVHALALVSGYTNSNVFVDNAAVAMYGRCGACDTAQQLFDEMLERGVFDTISWNSIISVYVRVGECRRALRMFEQMVSKGDIMLRADAVSLVNVLPACASVKSWRSGMEIHGYALRRGLLEDVFVGNAIIDMYAKCGLMDQAKNVFGRMELKDVVSWNALVTGYSQIGKFDDALLLFQRMREKDIELNVVTWSAVIAGYAQRGLGNEALDVFREMILSGSQPNAITLVSVLSGCAAVGTLVQGKEIQCYVIKQFLDLEANDRGDEMMVINGLIDMYAKCKNFRIARTMFDSIERKHRSVVTWTVMIGGYAQHGEATDALELFSEMLSDKHRMMPNGFTISCALVACARLGAHRIGREIHSYALRNRYEEAMLFISNCLIDMYAKSGDVDAARAVFDNMIEKNAVSWTSIMTGYGLHGRGEEALHIFNGMKTAGLPVDGVTFVVVLYACSHSGMVEQGINYFNNMKEDFGVVPEVEHYACMVDLLGRAGRLNEAMNLIKDMPMEPNPIVWVALLSGCRLHGNVELGEHAVDQLLALNFENDGLYTLLSNLYASARRWKDVARIRLLMKHSGVKKRPGCSWVQGKKGTATFFVGDKSHPMTKEIYNLLGDLIHRIKIMGYIPETSFALHDVDDEEKGDLLFEHSEKLALAYAILTTAAGIPIRITKNLRVCGDCHTAITYISRIIEHEVILRDPSRFHHFKNGSCSCKGYW